jgi:mono/diheme cytochrome c family protein
MGTRKILLGVALLFVVAVSALSACGDASGEPSDQSVSVDGETLLQERCTECHGLERTTSAQKTREEWESTLTRMVNRGAELSDAEKTVLVDYLADTYGS